jgi:hypothetical protein
MLAIPMERYYYLTTSLYDGAGWMARPGVVAFAVLLIGPLVWALVKKLRGASGAVDDGHRNELEVEEPEGDELEGSMAGTGWSFAVALVAVVMFVVALWVTGSFSEEARLMPRLVSVCGLVVAGVLLRQDRRGWRGALPESPSSAVPEATSGSGSTMVAHRVANDVYARREARHRDLVVAGRTFAAMAVFLVLVVLGGYLAATLVFVPVCLLYAARTTPRTAVVYTLVLGLVLLSLPSLLPVELPMGMLQ